MSTTTTVTTSTVNNGVTTTTTTTTTTTSVKNEAPPKMVQVTDLPKAKVDNRPDPKILKQDEVGSTRWVKLSTLTYADRNGSERKWDVVSRTTKKEGMYADAVFIVCILNGGQFASPHILLVKQWRPAMAKYSIEMPAGLIDQGETPEQAAVRELHEECGFHGKAVSCSPELNLSPGLSNETGAVVHVQVDMGASENIKPKQELDDGEDIEVLYVAVADLIPRLKEFNTKGYSVFLGLYSMALSLNGLV